MDADSPDYLVHEIFSSNFWKDHSLGKPILGTRETVKRFNQAMVQDYYRSVYTPANLLITAAGNLTHERLVNLARERFERCSRTTAAPPQAAPATHARIALRNRRRISNRCMSAWACRLIRSRTRTGSPATC